MGEPHWIRDRRRAVANFLATLLCDLAVVRSVAQLRHREAGYICTTVIVAMSKDFARAGWTIHFDGLHPEVQ
jgi:hypothetical protein